MTSPHGQGPGERGSVTIWMVTASFVMMMLVGLAVDLGGQAHALQRAHDLAAQAARAGGQQVQAAPAIEGRSLRIDPSAARAAAQEYLSAVGAHGTASITGGDTITVHVADTYRPRFLGLLGITHLDVTGTASARLIRSLAGAPR
jgi:Flp pilus assembly protein TadG